MYWVQPRSNHQPRHPRLSRAPGSISSLWRHIRWRGSCHGLPDSFLLFFFLGFSLEKQHEDMIRKNWELIKQHGGYKKSFEHGVLWAKHQDSKWGYSDWQEWADSANQKAFFWGIGVGWMLQMRCKTLQCPNFMIYLGTPRTRNAESTRNRKIYNSCRKKHCWLRGLIPPKKRIWIMAMLWYPAKRYYLFVSMSVHLYMAKEIVAIQDWTMDGFCPSRSVDGAYLQFKLDYIMKPQWMFAKSILNSSLCW